MSGLIDDIYQAMHLLQAPAADAPDTMIFNPIHRKSLGVIPMSELTINDYSFCGIKVIEDNNIQATRPRIPPLSNELNISNELRERVNKTLAGFGEEAVVYMVNSAALRHKYEPNLFGAMKFGINTL